LIGISILLSVVTFFLDRVLYVAPSWPIQTHLPVLASWIVGITGAVTTSFLFVT
jgi:hypothetical protein